MSDLNFNGLALSFFVVILIFTAIPLLISVSIYGVEDYGRACNLAIHMPCMGLGND